MKYVYSENTSSGEKDPGITILPSHLCFMSATATTCSKTVETSKRPMSTINKKHLRTAT